MKNTTKEILKRLDNKMVLEWFYDQINERGVEFLEARGQYDTDGNLDFPRPESPETRRAYYIANIQEDALEADEWAASDAPIPPEGYYLRKASKGQVADACVLAIAFINFSSQPLPDTPKMTRLRAILCRDAVEDHWNFATMEAVAEDIAKDTNWDWEFDTPEEEKAYRERVREWFPELKE